MGCREFPHAEARPQAVLLFLAFCNKRASPAASGGLLSFALMQKKVTKEKIKFGA
jgi:hypothetical protein